MTRVAILALLILAVAVAYALTGRDEPTGDGTAEPVSATLPTTSTTAWVETQPDLGPRFGELVEAMKPKPPSKPRARTAPTPVTAVGVLQDMIRSAFARFGPVVAEQAVHVAGCESMGDPTGQHLDERAANGAHAGLFQLSRTYHLERAQRLGFTWPQMYTAAPNIAVAVDLFAEKKHWAPTWSCAWAA